MNNTVLSHGGLFILNKWLKGYLPNWGFWIIAILLVIDLIIGFVYIFWMMTEEKP